MEICRKIDIHAHAIPFAQYEFIKGIEATEEDLFRLYDTIGVDRGVNMAAVASSIINEVRYKLENSTGIAVKAVNVYIDTIID